MEGHACNKCQVVAQEVKDMELNREIFDIIDDEALPEVKENNSEQLTGNIEEFKMKFENDEELIQVLEDLKSATNNELKIIEEPEEETVEETVPEVITKPSVTSKRRFDSVKSVLERVRQKLGNIFISKLSRDLLFNKK